MRSDCERITQRLAGARRVLGLVRQSLKNIDKRPDKLSAQFLERKTKLDDEQIRFSLHVEKLEQDLSAAVDAAKRATADAARAREQAEAEAAEKAEAQENV